MTMTQDELFDALDGLFAFDGGSIDSGIHDEQLRVRVIERLRQINQVERGPSELFSRAFSATMSDYISQYFLGWRAREQGYGFEDLLSFLRWLNDEMGIGAHGIDAPLETEHDDQ